MYTHLTDEEAEDKKTILPVVTQTVKDGTVVHSHFFVFLSDHAMMFSKVGASGLFTMASISA